MLESVLKKLEYFIQADAWKGYDPYDGLNSKFLRFLTFNRKWLRIAVIQFMKRSPINLRPFFGVAKSRNPKAMGLLVKAYLVQYKKTKKQEYLDKAREILDWLIANSAGYSGYSWGYNFNWQSAVFYIPKGIPTVVNTSFIANAFLDAYKITKEKNYLDIARNSCDFILNDLNRTNLSKMTNDISKVSSEGKRMTNDQNLFCFSYSPLDKTCCHNANLLAVELLARVYSITKEEKLLENAKKSLEFTLAHHNSDGSWYYGLAGRQQYIDSFHTGFVLVSLYNLINYIDSTDNYRFRRILMKGYEYYKKTFFEDDGLPRYYNNKIYPIDLHCSAQGIITFLNFKEYDNEAVKIAKKIANWTIENMWDDKKGYFYFQKTKLFTNKIQYLRWPNVWMFYALAELSLRGVKGREHRVEEHRTLK